LTAARFVVAGLRAAAGFALAFLEAAALGVFALLGAEAVAFAIRKSSSASPAATHSSIASSTACLVFQGPRRWITSALWSPLMVSAKAFPLLSPLEPTDDSMPASAKHSL
jgi:hypothetical protein